MSPSFGIIAFILACNVLSVETQEEASFQSRDVCTGNTPSTRNSWCNHDINTNYHDVAPDTGVIREYWLEIKDAILALDGVERKVQAINGTIPGPTLIADWGDTLVVHVTNNLENWTNGSSIHFHGIRQNFTNAADGVVSITQCPTVPKSSSVYRFRATQYGSSWYHSHYGLQTYEGVFGGLIINGPASANYDEDLGTTILHDWSHQTVDEMHPSSQRLGPPTMDTALINGTNVYGEDDEEAQVGKRLDLRLEPGKKHRLRLVNGAIDSVYRVAIDNHNITVIAMDFVPVKPYRTDAITLNMGQRFDVIIEANQASVASAFWLRADPQLSCTKTRNPRNVKAMVHYGDDDSVPTTDAKVYFDSCDDAATSKLVPMVPRDVGPVAKNVYENVTLSKNKDHHFRWYLNGTSMTAQWDNPSLLKLHNNETFVDDHIAIRVPEPDAWVYLIIESARNTVHPIHLHGFDFMVLAAGVGRYNPDHAHLQTVNPPRRDTATLPAQGYIVIAFQADNPGIWLMHCHIGWHASEGFSLQFIVREKEIPQYVTPEDIAAVAEGCASWKNYTAAHHLAQGDWLVEQPPFYPFLSPFTEFERLKPEPKCPFFTPYE